MTALLIVNSDDFGLSSAVNAAVVKARRFGTLTSASLMVTGPAAREAVSIARDDPGLAVGLHLALTGGNSTLPREAIPSLVSRESRFMSNPALAGLKYYLHPSARRQLRIEIEAQFEAFAGTGLPLSHVDGHQHLHAHPAVLPIVVELASKYGARGIRLPHDPFWANIAADRSRILSKAAVTVGHAYLARVCRRLLRKSGLAHCEVTIGTLMSGAMSDDYVIRMLRSIRCSAIEVFFHPTDPQGSGYRLDPCGPNHGDLQALLSPSLKDFLETNGYSLTNYQGIANAGDRL